MSRLKLLGNLVTGNHNAYFFTMHIVKTPRLISGEIVEVPNIREVVYCSGIERTTSFLCLHH